MLSGEVDPPLWLEDGRLEVRLLLRSEQRKRPARPFVAIPGVRGTDLELLPDPRMDPLDVIERLLDARFLVHRAPLQSVGPIVRSQQDAASRWWDRRAGSSGVDREVGYRGTTADDAVLLLPEAVAHTEKDLG